MPHAEYYEDITRRCEECARGLVATDIVLSSRLLRTTLCCLICPAYWTPYHYDLGEGRYLSERFLAAEPTWGVSWACESGCESSCCATRIEVSRLYLRIKFGCPTCHGTAIRYYDLEQHGYADITGRIVPHFYNRYAARIYTSYVGAKWERLR